MPGVTGSDAIVVLGLKMKRTIHFDDLLAFESDIKFSFTRVLICVGYLLLLNLLQSSG